MLELIRLSNKNPLLSPRNLNWEKNGIFNPGAVIFNNQILLLYRAYGEDQVSRFGLASSRDGINFAFKQETSVFVPDPNSEYETHGVEDPRITLVDNRFAIVYTAATPNKSQMHSSVHGFKTRISLAWTDDFNTFERKGVIMHSYDDKDATLFPHKWGEYFYMYHRRYPNIWLSRSKDLNTWEDVCEENCLIVQADKDSWDGERIGIGSPPLYTADGWLVFYHGRDSQGVYRLGTFLADLQAPYRVNFKLPYPLLEPKLECEKVGKIPNVVFTCGAVEAGDEYFVYYGMADYAIGGARINRSLLLNELKKYPLL